MGQAKRPLASSGRSLPLAPRIRRAERASTSSPLPSSPTISPTPSPTSLREARLNSIRLRLCTVGDAKTLYHGGQPLQIHDIDLRSLTHLMQITVKATPLREHQLIAKTFQHVSRSELDTRRPAAKWISCILFIHGAMARLSTLTLYAKLRGA